MAKGGDGRSEQVIQHLPDTERVGLPNRILLQPDVTSFMIVSKAEP